MTVVSRISNREIVTAWAARFPDRDPSHNEAEAVYRGLVRKSGRDPGNDVLSAARFWKILEALRCGE